MPRRNSSLIVATAIFVAASAELAAAHPSRSKRQPPSAPGPSITDDAFELGVLAPPASRSTFAGTYGDAAIARQHLRSRGSPTSVAETPYPCDPRQARAGGYVCEILSPRPGYGQFYGFTPSAVSAPQSFAVDPSAQTPLLSPVTSLFWAANGVRFDPHN